MGNYEGHSNEVLCNYSIPIFVVWIRTMASLEKRFYINREKYCQLLTVETFAVWHQLEECR